MKKNIVSVIENDEYYGCLSNYTKKTFRHIIDFIHETGYCTLDDLTGMNYQTGKDPFLIIADIIKLLFLGYIEETQIENNSFFEIGSIKFKENYNSNRGKYYVKLLQLLKNNNDKYLIKNNQIIILENCSWTKGNYLPENLVINGNLLVENFIEEKQIIPANLIVKGYIRLGNYKIKTDDFGKSSGDVWLKLKIT